MSEHKARWALEQIAAADRYALSARTVARWALGEHVVGSAKTQLDRFYDATFEKPDER